MRPLLPLRRLALPEVACGVAAATALLLSTEADRPAPMPGKLLVQALAGDDDRRQLAAAEALQRLRLAPGIAAVRRVPAAEPFAAAGERLPPGLPLPPLVEATLAPGADAAAAARTLAGLPGVIVHPVAEAGRSVAMARLLAWTAALLLAVLAGVTGAIRLGSAERLLHRLGARGRTVVAHLAGAAGVHALAGAGIGGALGWGVAPGTASILLAAIVAMAGASTLGAGIAAARLLARDA